MNHYHHLSIEERESILFMRGEGKGIRAIATALGRSASTISRELKRNQTKKEYSPSQAEKKYRRRRKRCCRKKILADPNAKAVVKRLFLEEQWSPEQIAKRLKAEGNAIHVSYSTIYRAIYARMLDEKKLSHGERGVVRKLRHRGKTRHRKGTEETRGKLKISNPIEERPHKPRMASFSYSQTNAFPRVQTTGRERHRAFRRRHQRHTLLRIRRCDDHRRRFRSHSAHVQDPEPFPHTARPHLTLLLHRRLSPSVAHGVSSSNRSRSS